MKTTIEAREYFVAVRETIGEIRAKYPTTPVTHTPQEGFLEPIVTNSVQNDYRLKFAKEWRSFFYPELQGDEFRESVEVLRDDKKASQAEKITSLSIQTLNVEPHFVDTAEVESYSDHEPEITRESLRDETDPTAEPTYEHKVQSWALSTLETYDALPQSDKREMVSVQEHLRNVARHLLSDPSAIAIAVPIWLHKTSSEYSVPNGLINGLKEALEKEAAASWRGIKSDQHAALIRVYAHSLLGRELASRALRGYFNGPSSQDRSKEVAFHVDAMREFVSGLIDVVKDSKSLEEGVKVATFQSDIVTRSSKTFLDFQIAQGLMVHDEELLMKATKLKAVIAGLTELVDSQYNNDIERDDVKAFDFHLKRYQKLIAPLFKEANVKLGKREFDRRINLLTAMLNKSGKGFSSTQEIIDAYEAWPLSISTQSDPLFDKYNRDVIDRVQAEQTKQIVTAKYIAETRRWDMASRSLILPNGLIMDIFHPSSMDRNVLMETVMGKYAELPEELLNAFSKNRSLLVHRHAERIEIGDELIYFVLRNSARIEEDQHPIISLQEIGYPTIQLEGDKPLGQGAQQIADEIRVQRVRYLDDARGVRVKFQDSSLNESGFEYIDFIKDKDDVAKTIVRLGVRGLVYDFALDRNLNLDLGGLECDNQQLRDFLRFTSLSYLKPILCETRLKGEVGEDDVALERQIVSRMGHLRLLWQDPEDPKKKWYYTTRAIKLFRKLEEGDLIAVDLERKRMLMTTRDTTYVSPVIKDVDGMPPLELRVQTPEAFLRMKS